MIAALGLIFLDEETVFWWASYGAMCHIYNYHYSYRMMVAVIEKILPGKYYTPDLAGVQADQVSDDIIIAPPLTPPTNYIIESIERFSAREAATSSHAL